MRWKKKILYNKFDKIDGKLVDIMVKIIICAIFLIFFVICIKFGYSVGSAIGELIYNIKH